MAAIDKMHEFYTSTNRFIFLAQCYRPENLPEEVNKSMDILVKYFSNSKEFKESVDEANDFFEESDRRIQNMRLSDLVSDLIRGRY